jgi:hypothetical protein
MWTFLVELAAIEEQEAGNLYPETLFSWWNARWSNGKKLWSW